MTLIPFNESALGSWSNRGRRRTDVRIVPLTDASRYIGLLWPRVLPKMFLLRKRAIASRLRGSKPRRSVRAFIIRPGGSARGVPMKVLLAQLSPRVGDKKANIAKMEKTIANTEPDLALFGELYLTGYMARDSLRTLAEPIPGPAKKAVLDIAKEYSTHIIFGMPEKDSKARLLYNVAVLAAPDGGLEKYRKIHPATFGPFEEGIYFGRGREPKAVETKLGKIGLMICFDTFFPELARLLALGGADILAVISAAPNTSKPMFDKVLPARAVENTCFVLYCNLVGTELNIVFAGGTQAIGPRGEYIARAKDYQEDLVVADIDPADLMPARQARPSVRDAQQGLVDAAFRRGRRK